VRFATCFWLVVGSWVAWPVPAAASPLVVDLWPGNAPEETGNIGAERTRMSPKLDRKKVEVTESTRLVTNVTKPTITIYRPAKDKDTATAVLICPGGGYWDLYWQLEGEEVAQWLNSLGVTGMILKYTKDSWKRSRIDGDVSREIANVRLRGPLGGRSRRRHLGPRHAPAQRLQSVGRCPFDEVLEGGRVEGLRRLLRTVRQPLRRQQAHAGPDGQAGSQGDLDASALAVQGRIPS